MNYTYILTGSYISFILYLIIIQPFLIDYNYTLNYLDRNYNLVVQLSVISLLPIILIILKNKRKIKW